MTNEVLTKSTPAGEWIKDFVDSDNPKFAGKSAAKRKQMALAAYYAKQNESVEEAAAVSQNSIAVQDMEAVEYKGIGTDVVDKKKKLNPQPNFTMAKKQVKDFKEEKDNREYGYEGDMAMSQLKTIIRHSEHLMGMLKPDTDLPEWVQSKITLATDYMQTAHDYLMSEMNEEVEQIDEGENGLAAKAKKSGISLSTLKTVYKRGVAAWNSGHRPGTTPQQWGMARVNSYITKGSGTYGGADKDLHEDARLDKTEYHKGMSDSTAKARVAHWKKADKMSDSNPKAYKPAPGDKTAKTTPSVHTKKYHAMYGEEVELIDEISKKTADSYLSKVTKDQVSKHGIQPNMYDKLPKNRQQGVSNALKRLIKKEEVQVEEGKVYDPITKKMVATKPIKVQAGGGATRNGVPVETGPSKYKSKLPMSKAASVLAAEEVVELIQRHEVKSDAPHKDGGHVILSKAGKNWHVLHNKKSSPSAGDLHRSKLLHSYDDEKAARAKFKELKEEQIDELSKDTLASYAKKASKDARIKQHVAADFKSKEAHARNPRKKETWGSIAKKYQSQAWKREDGHNKAVDKLAKEEVQIDEVSKSTLMRYIPKASRDVADNVAMAKERQVTMAHATHAGNYDMAKKESGKSQISFKKAMQRLKGIDAATKKLGTQKEEVELDEAIAKKLPVQHAVDAVHATLGPKSATRFLSHLSPGTDKHTSWDKVNDALVKQGVQTHHIASIAQKTSHMNEEVIDESRGHKVLATFFKNREVAQRAYQGNPAKDAEVAQGGGSPADQGIAAAKRDAEELKKKVNEVKAPAVHAAPPKKTKSTAKEYASASIPGTKRVAHAKPDDNEVGGGTATRIAEDQYTSEYKIKQFVDPVTGENKTRKIRPHRINFKASKMHGEPAQQDAPGDYGIKEGFDDYSSIAKELVKRHGKNVTAQHVKDFAGERDTHRGLDHAEVMHHVKKLSEDDKVYDEKWKTVKFTDFIKGAK